MSNETEEKKLPPSEHKLRKARERGQVASSAEFVGGTVAVTTIVFIAMSWQSVVVGVSGVFDSGIASMTEDNTEITLSMLLLTGSLLWNKLGILGVILSIVAIVANVVHKGGVPFSLHPIKPEFKKINPGEGLKKLFGFRNSIEFGISLVKITLWFAICLAIFWFGLGTLMKSISCGAACALDRTMDMALIIAIVAIFMLIVTGLLDIPLQFSLFKREQKMGHSESKRERKDTHGNPEIKSRFKDQYRELIDDSGGGDVTFYLRGVETVVGISYDPTLSTLPRVTTKVGEAGSETVLARAKSAGIPIIADNQLAADIAASVQTGGIVRERHFERVAGILIGLGAIG